MIVIISFVIIIIDSGVCPSKKGLLLERKQDCDESDGLAVLFTLSHPLHDLCPLTYRIPTSIKNSMWSCDIDTPYLPFKSLIHFLITPFVVNHQTLISHTCSVRLLGTVPWFLYEILKYFFIHTHLCLWLMSSIAYTSLRTVLFYFLYYPNKV